MAHITDPEIIATTHNTARFFTENRQISWVLLLGTLAWGVYGYLKMPQRKDPEIPVRVAVALCPWPGASTEKIEQLVTRRIEQTIAENPSVSKITSDTRGSVSIVYVELNERITETGREFDDIKGRLDGITDLPQGAGPINFIKDFGDTAALMLTVASPKVSDLEIGLRARDVQRAIGQVRLHAKEAGTTRRFTLLYCFPPSIQYLYVARHLELGIRWGTAKSYVRDARPIHGPGFTGVDGAADADDATILEQARIFTDEHLGRGEFHPDSWEPTVVREPSEVETKLKAVAGDKYSYREMDDFTDLIQRTIQTVPQVSKVTRSGILKERVFLSYSQERMASFGASHADLEQILGARNITLPGGLLEVQTKNLTIDPSGEFKSEKEIGDVIVGASSSGTPVYLRDFVDVARAYEIPAQFLNFYNWRDSSGAWHRSRAVTLAVEMRPGEQIGQFGKEVDKALKTLRQRLPDDLIIARTSDQPQQVRESIDLFMHSLYEAIALVVLVALIGFWEWRSALLMALSIPITLAMTFGMMHVLRLDLQQVSIASLIIALGLLVDDPVVAGDAIKRDLALGHPRAVAAWLGPTKLATAILFATITNIVAYLPFLTMFGDIGRFLYSLPLVLACSLIASRIVSMTFIPLLAYYILRANKRPEPLMDDRRTRGFTGLYYRLGGWVLDHRWQVFSGSLLVLATGGYFIANLKESFFPKDYAYLSTVDVWLPEDAPLSATNQAARHAENIVQRVAEEFGKEHPGRDGKPRDILESVTTFVGGGGPRFWFSISPEQQQLNYAQLIVQVKNKQDTNLLVVPLQEALSAEIPGTRLDIRQLETAAPIPVPVAVRISGDDISTLRLLAEEVKDVFRSIPNTDRIRDDWGAENFVVKLQVDPDRANLAGVSNLDVAASSATGMYGRQVAVLREGDKQIPVLLRLRPEERAQLEDIQNLYVHSLQNPLTVPLGQVSTVSYNMETGKLLRRNQFRTITVGCFPTNGVLPSQIMESARARLTEFERTLPPGYGMEIAGEEEEQAKEFPKLAIAMAISVIAIFLALVIQFRHAIKPFVVFAAIPFGMVGALAALTIMGAPFGFMAFLGIASLIGVIVSHIIVLFDFIEEMAAKGEPLREALLDAGIVRLRPVMITVGATVLGLVPLVLNGGPLWEPLCYAQIGGLTVATFVTLLLVPVLYSIFVLDLKIVRWGTEKAKAPATRGS